MGSREAIRSFKKPVFAKDPETFELIKNFIRDSDKMNVLFAKTDEQSVKDLVNAFEEVSYVQDQDIITQGDDGNFLYLIKEGSVDIFVARVHNGTLLPPGKVGTLGPGAVFGELALMYNAPRAATVRISSPVCTLWRLGREPFRMLIAQLREHQCELYEGWLNEVAILKLLNKYELSHVAELMEAEVFEDGEIIVKQGDEGDAFYIVEEGNCSAYIEGNEGEIKVADYGQGNYFGEIALLKNVPRQATIRATSDISVIYLKKDHFTQVLGPISDILKRNISEYPEYADMIALSQ